MPFVLPGDFTVLLFRQLLQAESSRRSWKLKGSEGQKWGREFLNKNSDDDDDDDNDDDDDDDDDDNDDKTNNNMHLQ